MITSVIIILLFLGVLVLVIRMYTFKGMVYTPEEVADIIEKFLDGSGGEWDWDDFTSITIKDAYLDGIRCKCASLRDEYPPQRPNEYCSDAGAAIMRNFVKELRERAA